jgi:CRISPR/Cas system CSM-associated protein Csm2 small subunit
MSTPDRTETVQSAKSAKSGPPLSGVSILTRFFRFLNRDLFSGSCVSAVLRAVSKKKEERQKLEQFHKLFNAMYAYFTVF